MRVNGIQIPTASRRLSGKPSGVGSTRPQRWAIVLFALMAFLSVTIFDLLAAADEKPAVETGMTILGKRDGAKIYVDEKHVATLPQSAPIPLQPGPHKLRITQSGFSPFERDIQATLGRVILIEVEMLPVAGVLKLSSVPPGAAIYIDDQNVGLAPAELEVQTGPHTIILRLDGHYSETFSLPMSPGQVVTRSITLSTLPAAINPNRPVRIQVRPWYERAWVWVVIIGGTAVLTTAIAVPAVLATRSSCDKLGAEVCFTIAPQTQSTSGALQLGVAF